MISEDLRDELDAIEAIYPNCLTRVNDNIIELKVPENEHYKIRISFPADYPEKEPPHILQVWSSEQDDNYLQTLFNEVLDSVYHEGVCIFDFLTELNGILYVEDEGSSIQEDQPEEVHLDALEGWIVSDPVIDRASTFIAFVRAVSSEGEVSEKINLLKTDKRINRAHHNMVAYRISSNDGTRVADCDDDGETAAGSRLLHLLSMMDVSNLVVVVSRWYGGVHLGPDRFKHINSTARDAIQKAGLINEQKKKKK